MSKTIRINGRQTDVCSAEIPGQPNVFTVEGLNELEFMPPYEGGGKGFVRIEIDISINGNFRHHPSMDLVLSTERGAIRLLGLRDMDRDWETKTPVMLVKLSFVPTKIEWEQEAWGRI